jgi:hypothetical protein
MRLTFVALCVIYLWAPLVLSSFSDCTGNGCITGTVWVDENCDGNMDDSETGRLENVRVQLFDITEGFYSLTFTNSNGGYTFRQTPTGHSYQIQFTVEEEDGYSWAFGADSSVFDEEGITIPILLVTSETVNAAACPPVVTTECDSVCEHCSDISSIVADWRLAATQQVEQFTCK